MKARLLRKIMNDTKYIPENNEDYISMGSALCHNLISVNKKTLEVKYALDTFGKGRASLKHEELEFIWDKFHELIKTGEIHDIINGVDEIENSIPVWTVKDGQLIETYTDEYGWPNTTYDGYVMYENIYFKTKKEAIEYAISENESGIRFMSDVLDKKEKELKEDRLLLNKYKERYTYFKSLI